MPGENIGGLNYEINITGNFSERIKSFEDSIKRLETRQATIKTGADKAGTVEAQKQAKATAQTAKNVQASTDAVRLNNKFERDLLIKKERVAELADRFNISQNKAAGLIGVSAAQAEQLKLNLFDAQQVARQFLFTFRRLVGILAVFTLARKLAQNIGAAVNEMSRFNAEIEIAEIGIASIVASVGQVRDAQGNLVTGADAFAASLGASQAILAQLKKDAIGSIATFEALVKSYQVAIGPGLAAGLDLDQVRVLSKRLAEGAISLGVPLNQLSEEIRSLLQGTATARNTRIAVLFGGAKEANEAIRNAKEQGNLYEVLTEKLQGVAQGADAANQSFNVLQSNLQDSIQLLLAEGGIEYFDQLKESILGLTRALTTIDDEGELGFTPEAFELVQALSGGLTDLIKNVREFTDTKQVLSQVTDALRVLTGILSAAAPLAISFFSGLATGVGLVLKPLEILLSDFQELVAALKRSPIGRAFLTASKYITAGVVGLLLWRKIIIQISLLIGSKGLLGAYNLLRKAILLVATDTTAFNTKLALSNLLAAILGKQMDQVALKAALASGGLTVLLGILVYVIARMTILRDKTADVSDLINQTNKEMEGLEDYTVGAADAMEEGVRSAEEWRDAIEGAVNALIRAKGLEALSGDAKDFASNLVEAKISFDEQTESLRRTRSVLQDNRREWRRQQDDINATLVSLDAIRVSSSGQLFFANFAGYPELAKQVNELAAERDRLTGLQRANTEEIADIEAKILKILGLQTQAINERLSQQTLLETQTLNAAEAELKIATLRKSGITDLARDVGIAAARVEVFRAQLAIADKERTLELETLDARIASANSLADSVEKQRVLRALTAEKVRLEEEYSTQQAVALERMREQARVLERQQKLFSGRFTDALSVGLEDFVTELPALGEQIADTISGALSDLSGVVASTFKDAIDPRTDADLKTAFGEFFLDLAGQFVEAITSQLISSAIQNLFSIDIGKDAALQTNTAALSTLNASISALNATIANQALAEASAPSRALAGNALGAGLSQGAGTHAADTAAQEGAGAAVGAAAKANPLLLAILLPILIGLISQAFKKGGVVKGYASGGPIAEGLPRPSHIPASDTVPAWLTPGEFVVKKSAVQKYGTGMLNALNSGVLNPKTFSATGLALGGMVRGVQHFANGGTVSKSIQPTVNQSTKTIIAPVMVSDEKNANQIFTGGRRALTDNVNKVPIVGDINAGGLG